MDDGLLSVDDELYYSRECVSIIRSAWDRRQDYHPWTNLFSPDRLGTLVESSVISVFDELEQLVVATTLEAGS